MTAPLLPPDEDERLTALQQLGILDTDAEDRFDRITRIAQALFDAPIVLISIVDRHRQWFKSRQGTDLKETAREISVCGHAILGTEPFVIEDLRDDPRFADNPLVTDDPHLRFYAGQPLRTVSGHAVGTLCVLDRKPRRFDEENRRKLRDLAGIAEDELNAAKLVELQREAQAAQDELKRFFTISLDMLCIATFDGVFKKLNPAWSKVLGYELDELVGRPFLDFVHPDDWKKTVEAAQSLTEGGTVVAFENRYRCKDGSFRDILWSSAPDPETRLFIAAARDITDRRKARDELMAATAAAEEANQAKSRFLANMSHEFRTPLNSVIGFANVLLKKVSSKLHSEEQEYLERIRSNGESLLLLVNDILDLSKVEAGRIEINETAVLLDQLVDEVVEQLEVQARAKGIQLSRTPGGPWSSIDTDEQRLRQILINLVGNAIKFTESGSVTLRVHAQNGRPTRIDVEDTGIGISEEDQARVFEAFHQVDASSSRTYQGTGLGLAISKSLSDLLGYRLTCDSTPGKGTTFQVWLETNAAEESA